jgi:hypothetical protein
LATCLVPEKNIFGQNLHYFSCKAWELKNDNLHIFNLSFSHMKQKTFQKVCSSGCRGCFCKPIFMLSASKTVNFALKKRQFLTKTTQIFFQFYLIFLLYQAKSNFNNIFFFSGFWIKNSYFLSELAICFWQNMGTQNANLHIFILSVYYTKQTNILQKILSWLLELLLTIHFSP